MNVTRADMDACKFLGLWKLCEQQGGRILRIEIAGDSDTLLFEVTWPSYVSYQISGETMGPDRPSEVFDGTKFRCYTKSAYLDYVALTPSTEVMMATETGRWPRARHWAIYCMDDTVDVVSIDAPQIRLLEPPASWAEEKISRAGAKRIFEETLARNRERSILSTIEERMKKETRD